MVLATFGFPLSSYIFNDNTLILDLVSVASMNSSRAIHEIFKHSKTLFCGSHFSYLSKYRYNLYTKYKQLLSNTYLYNYLTREYSNSKYRKHAS